MGGGQNDGHPPMSANCSQHLSRAALMVHRRSEQMPKGLIGENEISVLAYAVRSSQLKYNGAFI